MDLRVMVKPEASMDASFGSSETEERGNELSCQFCTKKFALQAALDAHLKTKHPFRSSAKLHGTSVSLDAFLGLADQESKPTSPPPSSVNSPPSPIPNTTSPLSPTPNASSSPTPTSSTSQVPSSPPNYVYPWLASHFGRSPDRTESNSLLQSSLLKRKLTNSLHPDNLENTSPLSAKLLLQRETISDFTRQQLQQFLVTPRRELPSSGETINNNHITKTNNNLTDPQSIGADAAVTAAAVAASSAAGVSPAAAAMLLMGSDPKMFGQGPDNQNGPGSRGIDFRAPLDASDKEPNVPSAQEVNNMLLAAGFDLSPYADAKRSGSLNCPRCPKIFDNVYSLRAHLKAVHLNIRPHKCSFCGKAFPQLWKLRQHTRLVHTHKGVRPYKCAYCDHASSLIHNCKAHIKQKHPGLDVKVITETSQHFPEGDENLDHLAEEGSEGQEHDDELDMSHNSDLNVTLEGDDEIEVENSVESAGRVPSLLTKENVRTFTSQTELRAPIPHPRFSPSRNINDLFASRLASAAAAKSSSKSPFLDSAFNGQNFGSPKKTLSSLFSPPLTDTSPFNLSSPPFPPSSSPPHPSSITPPSDQSMQPPIVVQAPPMGADSKLGESNPFDQASTPFSMTPSTTSSSKNRRKKSKPNKIASFTDIENAAASATSASATASASAINNNPTFDAAANAESSPEDREVGDITNSEDAQQQQRQRLDSGESSSPQPPPPLISLMTANYRQRLAPKILTQQHKENNISIYDETDRAFLSRSSPPPTHESRNDSKHFRQDLNSAADSNDDIDNEDGLCDSPAPLRIDEGGAMEQEALTAPMKPPVTPTGLADAAWEEGERDEMAKLAERKLEEMRRQTQDLQLKRMSADYQRFIESAKVGFAGVGQQDTLNFLRSIQMLAATSSASSSPVSGSSNRPGGGTGSIFTHASNLSSKPKPNSPFKTSDLGASGLPNLQKDPHFSSTSSSSSSNPLGNPLANAAALSWQRYATLAAAAAAAQSGMYSGMEKDGLAGRSAAAPSSSALVPYGHRMSQEDEEMRMMEEDAMMNGENSGEVSRESAGMSSVACPQCPKLFSSSTYLKYHLESSHGESNKRFTCNFCGKKFPQSWKVQRHMRLVHTHKGVKEFQCGYCPHASALLHNCKSHIKAKHPGFEIKVIRLNPPELQQNSNATKLLTSGVAAAAAAASVAGGRNTHQRSMPPTAVAAATPPVSPPPLYGIGRLNSMPHLGVSVAGELGSNGILT